MLKVVTILRYLDSPILATSAPAAEVLFILTADPSPPYGRWWPTLLPPPQNSADSMEGALTPNFHPGVDSEK